MHHADWQKDRIALVLVNVVLHYQIVPAESQLCFDHDAVEVHQNFHYQSANRYQIERRLEAHEYCHMTWLVPANERNGLVMRREQSSFKFIAGLCSTGDQLQAELGES